MNLIRKLTIFSIAALIVVSNSGIRSVKALEDEKEYDFTGYYFGIGEGYNNEPIHFFNVDRELDGLYSFRLQRVNDIVSEKLTVLNDHLKPVYSILDILGVIPSLKN